MAHEKRDRADFVTLQYIVEQYMLFAGETTSHKFMIYYQAAINGFKKLNYDVIGSIRNCTKDLSSTNTIKLPKDFISYTRIGCVNGGKIQWLGRHDGILIDRCNNVLKDNSFALSYFSPQTTVDGFQEVINNFGAGGGNNANGYYNIDTEKGVIAFDSTVSGSIFLEYISDGIEDNDEIFTHSWTVDAIMAFIHWQNIAFKRSVSGNEKELAKIAFDREERLLLARSTSFTKEELLQTIRKHTQATPKF